LLGFEVLVEQRQREVPEVDQRDLGTGVSGTLGGNAHEFLVEGFPASATGEGQNSWHHGGPSFVSGRSHARSKSVTSASFWLIISSFFWWDVTAAVEVSDSRSFTK
jgi:hypothetical protein